MVKLGMHSNDIPHHFQAVLDRMFARRPVAPNVTLIKRHKRFVNGYPIAYVFRKRFDNAFAKSEKILNKSRRGKAAFAGKPARKTGPPRSVKKARWKILIQKH